MFIVAKPDIGERYILSFVFFFLANDTIKPNILNRGDNVCVKTFVVILLSKTL